MTKPSLWLRPRVITRSAGTPGKAGGGPPLAAVVGLDRGPLPGEVIIRRWHESLAGPLALVHRQVAEPRMLARVGVNATITLAERSDRPRAGAGPAQRLPAQLGLADWLEQPPLPGRDKDLRPSPDETRERGGRPPHCCNETLCPDRSRAWPSASRRRGRATTRTGDLFPVGSAHQARGHVEQIADGDLGLACVRQGQ